jgi:hypothetical protein
MPHQHTLAGCLRLGPVHAAAAQRRVDIEVVGDDAIRHAPRVGLEKVGRDDFEIVIRGVREGTAAAELVEEMPYLIAAGPAVVSGMLESAMPPNRPTAWYTALLDRVRLLVPR